RTPVALRLMFRVRLVPPGLRALLRLCSPRSLRGGGLTPGSGLPAQCPDHPESRTSGADNQRRRKQRADQYHGSVPPDELSYAVHRRGRTGLHWLVAEVPRDLGRQGVRGFVSPATILFQALHHDPVQIAAEKPRKRSWIRAPSRREH